MTKTALRVAAYCRVSTDDPEQETSLAAQEAHWHEAIAARADWRFAGLYAEAGVSGTKAETRP